MTPSRDRIYLMVSVAAVGLGLIAGWSMLGSRSDQRALEADRRRVEALRSVASQVRSAASSGEGIRAPESWERIAMSLPKAQTQDPETGTPYDYKRISDTAFSLCATFSRPTAEGELPYQAQFWEHPAGYHCYQFDLKQSWPW